MTKSNQRAVRRRKANQRIQTQQYDRIEQGRARAYQERHKSRERVSGGEAVGPIRKWYRQVMARIRRRISSFFRPRMPRIGSLNLRSSDEERFGPFGPGQRRGAGAAWLRDTFSARLKMRSTRDGKPV